ncbi:MAG: efflux RND transporter periplasmic adaptor subunit [Burkholderiales bacterium]|nr:efflux RND transporter periplasmic adaptor subunit [Burkholderiales bacterium]
MDKKLTPFSTMSPIQYGASKLWLLSVLAVMAFAASWFYPDIKNKLSTLLGGEEMVASDIGRAKSEGGKSGKDARGGGEGSRNTPVSVGEVRNRDVRFTVQAAGTLMALNTAVVRAKVDGELKALRFTEGQYVQAGQLLAEIDSRPFDAQLNQAQGQWARDTALLKNAELDLQRYQDLLSKDAIARQQVETQAALVRQLLGTVQADQAQIDLARLQLSYTRVTAPISGRLGLKQVELGSLVRASDPNGVVSITQTQPMAVVFSVPEIHVPLIMRQLKLGKALVVEAWDRDQKIRLAQGRVSTTDNAIDVATGTLRLKATLDNRDGSLFPNQFANIRLQLDTLKNALVVPVQAVQRGAAGTFVYVVQADKTVQVQAVQLEAVEGDWQAVIADLKAGQQVITDGADRLRNGSGVEVVKAAKP